MYINYLFAKQLQGIKKQVYWLTFLLLGPSLLIVRCWPKLFKGTAFNTSLMEMCWPKLFADQLEEQKLTTTFPN